MNTVMAISEAKNNAQLIAECAQLGYLQKDWEIIDATYGKGRFWTEWRPSSLTTNDLDASTSATYNYDFTDMIFPDHCFDAVVFDPPYKLNGTSTSKGPASGDESYGIKGKYVPIDERHQLIYDGLDECLRVLKKGGMLLVKCQDQVSSGRVHWQTMLFTQHLADDTKLVDMLHLPGYRRQPMGRRQLHARRNYSTLLVLRKT